MLSAIMNDTECSTPRVTDKVFICPSRQFIVGRRIFPPPPPIAILVHKCEYVSFPFFFFFALVLSRLVGCCWVFFFFAQVLELENVSVFARFFAALESCSSVAPSLMMWDNFGGRKCQVLCRTRAAFLEFIADKWTRRIV